MKMIAFPGILLLFATMQSITGCRTLKSSADCRQFRTGKFRMVSDPERIEYIITRNDSVQTEHNLTTGRVAQTRVKWTSPCSYELTLLSTNEFVSDAADEYSKLHPLQVKIIKQTKDYYIFSASMKGTGLVLKDTLRVIQ